MKKILIVVSVCLLVFSLLFWAQRPQNKPLNSLELPMVTSQDEIVKHTGYTLSYNEAYEQANWVAYELTAEETQKAFDRTNKFISDPGVPTGSADDADYRGSGYDRGHLAPAADMGWSETTMRESFYFSNMSPQRPEFNRGIWKELEELVRDWARDYHKIYVVTGPVLEKGLPTIGHDHVSVPKAYYKVILDYSGSESKGIGFILPNEGSARPVSSYAVTIDSVEKLTHLDFYPALPDDREKKIESTLCVSCWEWESSDTQSFSPRKSTNIASEHQTGDKVQCHGITKAGNRCKNMTKNPSGYCVHHEGQMNK